MHTQADWLWFRQMRNKCPQANRKAHVSYCKEQFSLCGSNPKKFWKMVKDLGPDSQNLNCHFFLNYRLMKKVKPSCYSTIKPLDMFLI
jgi:hypothetical protein